MRSLTVCTCTRTAPALCPRCQHYAALAQARGVALGDMPPVRQAARVVSPTRYVPPATLDPAMLELPFMEEIRKLARHHGWLCFHAYSSRKSAPGYPDLCLLRGTSLLYAELKTQEGRVTLEQTEWLYALEYGGYESYVWTPQDWPHIRERLA